jgi:6-pyruvoyltetrahydropterin/6-carboxytetrahydropterin synthase
MIQQFYPQINHHYKYELNKDMNFSSAHFIPDERAGNCSNIHGHTYFVNVTICGNLLDDIGFLVNFKDLKKLVHGRFDHDLMNNKMEAIPSTELVAKEIYDSIQSYLDTLENSPMCMQVVVRETPTSYVVYRP